MWGSVSLLSYPSTLTAQKTLTYHKWACTWRCPCMCMCIALCWFSKSSLYHWKRDRPSNSCYLHKGTSKKHTCFHCSWLARSPLKLYDLLLYIRTEICMDTSGSLFALLVPRLLTTNTVHNFMAGMLLCSQQIQQQALQCSRHMSFQSPFLSWNPFWAYCFYCC